MVTEASGLAVFGDSVRSRPFGEPETINPKFSKANAKNPKVWLNPKP